MVIYILRKALHTELSWIITINNMPKYLVFSTNYDGVPYFNINYQRLVTVIERYFRQT